MQRELDELDEEFDGFDDDELMVQMREKRIAEMHARCGPLMKGSFSFDSG